jgi:hypothetical protein
MMPVRTWLVRLAMRCVPMSDQELEQRVAEYARGLADLPPGAFCGDALEAISRDEKFLPPYAVLRTALITWWDHHKPQTVGSTSDLPLGIRAAVEAWKACNLDDRLDRLRIMRRYQPKAYAYLIEQHDGARKLAAAQGWLSETQRESPRVAVPA